MAENLKRFRIEFTVDVHNEGVTKDWDWSNDEIEHSAIQELTCMVPYPEDITFSEVGNPWHTGIPTDDGDYLFAIRDSYWGVRYSADKIKDGEFYYGNVHGQIIAYQKITLYKEKTVLEAST